MTKTRHSILKKFLLPVALVLIFLCGAVIISNRPVLAAQCNISNGGLNEASGLAASIKHAGVVYTHNDEKGPIFAIKASTCQVIGKITVNGARSDPDPEAITINHKTGEVWFGDIGNGHPTQPRSMTDKKAEIKHPGWPARILVFQEPATLNTTITPRVVDIKYAGGDRNSEALLANPKTGQGYIIGKYASSPVFKLPNPLKSGTATDTGVRIPGWVTDATYTNDGKWILVRYRTATDPAPTNIYTYSADWKLVGKIAVPKVPQGESITMSKDGKLIYLGSEGNNSPLVSVPLPAAYGDINGDLIPTKISLDRCKNFDRKVLTAADKTQYCAKRADTKANAPECTDMPAGYAKLTYVKHASGDYCGYW